MWGDSPNGVLDLFPQLNQGITDLLEGLRCDLEVLIGWKRPRFFGLDFGQVGPVSGIYSFISEEHMKFVGDGLVRDIHTSDLLEVILTESKE